MKEEFLRGEVWNIVLYPAVGSEQKGLRPCVIISHESMNTQLETIIVVPLTTKSRNWPSRVDLEFDGKIGQALCEQIKTVSKSRFKKKLGHLRKIEVAQIRLVLRQMLFD